MSVFFLIGLRPFPQYPAHEASPFTARPNTKNDTFSDIDVDIILLRSGIAGQLLLLILYLVVN